MRLLCTWLNQEDPFNYFSTSVNETNIQNGNSWFVCLNLFRIKTLWSVSFVSFPKFWWKKQLFLSRGPKFLCSSVPNVHLLSVSFASSFNCIIIYIVLRTTHSVFAPEFAALTTSTGVSFYVRLSRIISTERNTFEFFVLIQRCQCYQC